MTMTIPNLPAGMHQLSPHLVCDGAADAISFYEQAFGAEELIRIPGDDGRLMHAAVVINGSSVLLVDENREYGLLSPKTLGGTPVTIHLAVADADAAYDRAVAAGAAARMPVAEMFWGDRYGQLEDPFGHRWSVATHTRDMTPEEMHKAMAEAGSR
jgi:PhnB protein